MEKSRPEAAGGFDQAQQLLASLTAGGMPAVYDRGFDMYVANVSGSTESAEIRAEYAVGAVSAAIDGRPAAAGQAVVKDSLKQGDNLVRIEIVKQDGSVERHLLDIMKFPTVTALETEGGEVTEHADGTAMVKTAAGGDPAEVMVYLDGQLESGARVMVDGLPYSFLGTVFNDSFLLEFNGLSAGTHRVEVLAAGTQLILKKFDLILPALSQQAA